MCSFIFVLKNVAIYMKQKRKFFFLLILAVWYGRVVVFKRLVFFSTFLKTGSIREGVCGQLSCNTIHINTPIINEWTFQYRTIIHLLFGQSRARIAAATHPHNIIFLCNEVYIAADAGFVIEKNVCKLCGHAIIKTLSYLLPLFTFEQNMSKMIIINTYLFKNKIKDVSKLQIDNYFIQRGDANFLFV